MAMILLEFLVHNEKISRSGAIGRIVWSAIF